jgi:hypothetical protein
MKNIELAATHLVATRLAHRHGTLLRLAILIDPPSKGGRVV